MFKKYEANGKMHNLIVSLANKGKTELIQSKVFNQLFSIRNKIKPLSRMQTEPPIIV